MALIGRLKRVAKDRQSVHREVEAAVSVLSAGDGKRYIQIDHRRFQRPSPRRRGQSNHSVQPRFGV
jgi:hypothetical protein